MSATSPTIPFLVPGNPFSWARRDLTSTARAPEGVFEPAVPDIGAEFAARAAAPPETKVPPQPFPATPSSPFSVPVPPALLPLVEHFFPQWLDANKAPALPSGGPQMMWVRNRISPAAPEPAWALLQHGRRHSRSRPCRLSMFRSPRLCSLSCACSFRKLVRSSPMLAARKITLPRGSVGDVGRTSDTLEYRGLDSFTGGRAR